MYFDARVLLADVENAAADIERYLDGVDRIAYIGADEKQAAVERKFEIIGEALNRLHVIDPDLSQRIPQLRRIVDFRNLLSHGYDRVIPERVWTYANNNLPELRRIVQALITELGPVKNDNRPPACSLPPCSRHAIFHSRIAPLHASGCILQNEVTSTIPGLIGNETRSPSLTTGWRAIQTCQNADKT